MMDPHEQGEDDCCRLCGFVFLEKKRKRNIVGEFAKKFEAVVGVELLEGDKRTVCDTCRYRVEKSWKSWNAIQEQLLKRKHPISPLSSSDLIPIRPNQILAETPLATNEAVKRQEHFAIAGQVHRKKLV